MFFFTTNQSLTPPSENPSSGCVANEATRQEVMESGARRSTVASPSAISTPSCTQVSGKNVRTLLIAVLPPALPPPSARSSAAPSPAIPGAISMTMSSSKTCSPQLGQPLLKVVGQGSELGPWTAVPWSMVSMAVTSMSTGHIRGVNVAGAGSCPNNALITDPLVIAATLAPRSSTALSTASRNTLDPALLSTPSPTGSFGLHSLVFHAAEVSKVVEAAAGTATSAQSATATLSWAALMPTRRGAEVSRPG
mmetsp:Transcript_2876/g.6784  ORF Transcript_2876/g.6784 Transcript_2876/m.6784 type:complete len:251 (+) Transcript_2876:2280-3032(+)